MRSLESVRLTVAVGQDWLVSDELAVISAVSQYVTSAAGLSVAE